MRTHLLLLFLLCSFAVNCQYKHYSLGLSVATNDFSNKFTSFDLNLQYNTRNTISFRTGLLIDNANSLAVNYVKTHPVDHYVQHTYESQINKQHFSIPALLQASVGKRIYLNLYGGIVYSALLTRPYVKTTVFLTDYPEHIYNEQVSYSEGKSTNGFRDEVNWYFGGGLTWPMKNGFTTSLEVSSIYRPNNRPVNSGFLDSHDDVGMDDRYAVFDQIRVQLGIAYQFNWKKDSDFKFITYSLSFSE